MCYADDARPPLPPIAGAAADRGDVELEAADGARVPAHFARAAQPNGAGIVVLPDVRGLHTFYAELAARFAEAGVDAVAVDYFARTGAASPPARGEHFDWRVHVERTSGRTIDADAAAGAEWLRSRNGGAVRAVFTAGFCFGGSNSWRQSATLPGLAGAIGFYGQPARVRDLVPAMRAPLLVLVAGADFTPIGEFELFDRQLGEAGVEHEMHVYPDAPHSFFDRGFEQHADACADAWERMLGFIAARTP